MMIFRANSREKVRWMRVLVYLIEIFPVIGTRARREQTPIGL